MRLYHSDAEPLSSVRIGTIAVRDLNTMPADSFIFDSQSLLFKFIENLFEDAKLAFLNLIRGFMHVNLDAEGLLLELSSPEISVVLGDGFVGFLNFLLVHHDLSAHHEPVYLLGEGSVVGEVVHVLASDNRGESHSTLLSIFSAHEFFQHLLALSGSDDVFFGLRFRAGTHSSLHVLETCEASSDKFTHLFFHGRAFVIEFGKAFTARDLQVSGVSQCILLGKAFIIGVFMVGKGVFSHLEHLFCLGAVVFFGAPRVSHLLCRTVDVIRKFIKVRLHSVYFFCDHLPVVLVVLLHKAFVFVVAVD